MRGRVKNGDEGKLMNQETLCDTIIITLFDGHSLAPLSKVPVMFP